MAAPGVTPARLRACGRATCSSSAVSRHTSRSAPPPRRAPPPSRAAPSPRRRHATPSAPPPASQPRPPRHLQPPAARRGNGVDDASPPDGDLTPLLVTYGGGVAGTLAVAALASLGADTWLNADDVFYGAPAGALSPGDVAGAALWSVALFYASPVQLLLLFLGRIDVERPSDATLLLLGRACSLPVDSSSYEAPLALRLANASLFALGGVATSALLSYALGGEATWAVSTGLGAALAAAVYEVGRPRRLSAAEATQLDAQWADFRAFADARLVRRGRCHISDVEKAYRRASPAFRATSAAGEGGVNAAGDADLRNFIANWHPGAERSSGGFYKNLSVAPEGPQTAAPGGGA